MTRSSRIALGVAASALLAGGIAVWATTDGPNGEVMIRAGAVLGAVWLVAPHIRRPALATVLWMMAGLAAMIRPRLAVVVVGAAVVWWLSRRSPRER